MLTQFPTIYSNAISVKKKEKKKEFKMKDYHVYIRTQKT